MDETTLKQFAELEQSMRDIVYAIKPPEHMLFDLDSTLLNTYGRQEGEAFNYHYQAHGYHPLLCFDGITGDLLKMELLALAASMRKQRIDTIRLKLMKIAARVVRSARYTTFKLCSSCPYKDEFYETLRNIQGLRLQLE